MKAILFVFTFLTAAISGSPLARADQDVLPATKLGLNSPEAIAALDALASSPGSIFRRYQPVIPSDMKQTAPLTVSGSDSQPLLKMSLCQSLGFLCPNVKMVGLVSLKPVVPSQGNCTKQYLMTMDLSRSDALLSGTYDNLKVAICYKQNPDGNGGTLSFNTAAHRGSNYAMAPQMLAGSILNFLKLQIPAITQAVQTTLQAYKSKQPQRKEAELEESEEAGVTPAA